MTATRASSTSCGTTWSSSAVRYRRARLDVFFDGQAYRVKLHGDGSSFCLNKNGTHGG